jgi:hypothetical protein
MVTRGTNGCMVPDPIDLPNPDGKLVVTINYPANDINFTGRMVYSGGHPVLADDGTGTGNLVPLVLDNSGSKEVTFTWYKALEGPTPSGMLTVISPNGDKHTHREYKLDTADPIDLTPMTVTGTEVDTKIKVVSDRVNSYHP